MTRVMKNSGIEWIGKISEDWKTIKFKYVFKIISGNGFSENIQGRSDGKYPFCKVSDINGLVRKVDFAKNYVNEMIVKEKKLTIIPKNSILIAKIGEALKKNHRKINVIDCIIDNNMEAFVLYKKDDVIFWYYVMESIDMLWFDNGGTIPCINNNNLKSFYIPDVDIFLKTKISDYLDSKCNKIDEIIEMEKQVIEKLKAYKQSVITEAVTKGLDPETPKKDSGIEWIGEIPDHWDVSKIGLFYQIQLGKMLQGNQKNAEDTLENYLCSVNLTWNGFNLKSIKSMYFSKQEKINYKLEKGDLIVTEGGDVAVSSIWKGEISECYIQNAVHRVRPQKDVINRFLYYWLFTLKNVGYIDQICNKATIAHFTKDKFSNSIFLLAPLQEQTLIANYLDAKCSKIDQAINQKEKLIEKLAQYKKSLIYECVTGKREVQDVG